MQYNPATFTLTNAVEQKGTTAEDWATICESLRKGKGITGIGGGFSKAIKAANDDYFREGPGGSLCRVREGPEVHDRLRKGRGALLGCVSLPVCP